MINNTLTKWNLFQELYDEYQQSSVSVEMVSTDIETRGVTKERFEKDYCSQDIFHDYYLVKSINCDGQLKIFQFMHNLFVEVHDILVS